MPEEVYTWIEKLEILTFEEIERLARIFVKLGVEKIRLTGGEPLVRKGVEHLISKLSQISELKDICLTTNGTFLSDKAEALKAAGLKRINISLDTLDSKKFLQITKHGELKPVLDGIFSARRVGFNPIKINAVIIRGINDDEIVDLVRFCRQEGLAMRFIEYMDVGNANGWVSEKMVSKQEILTRVHEHFPLRVKGRGGQGRAPAVDYEFIDGTGEIGIIGSVTEPFCLTCTRARLTLDGKLVTCLFSSGGVDLKFPLRNGATDEELTEKIQRVWANRKDRYSEERFEALKSLGGYNPGDRRKIEMITLGG